MASPRLTERAQAGCRGWAPSPEVEAQQGGAGHRQRHHKPYKGTCKGRPAVAPWRRAELRSRSAAPCSAAAPPGTCTSGRFPCRLSDHGSPKKGEARLSLGSHPKRTARKKAMSSTGHAAGIDLALQRRSRRRSRRQGLPARAAPGVAPCAGSSDLRGGGQKERAANARPVLTRGSWRRSSGAPSCPDEGRPWKVSREPSPPPGPESSIDS